jgi:ATP-dependent exoDNAse (exonuclease V) alpha subunit
MTPTNVTVDRINNSYIKSLSGQVQTYTATMGKDFPTKNRSNDDNIDIKMGAQVICLMNNHQDNEYNYVNGTIGIVTGLHKDHVEIELLDKSKRKVGRTTTYLYEPELDKNSNISYRQVSWYNQIDCKVCRAMTIHRTQGKTLDAGYISLAGWTPPSIVYVALSRMTTLDGLALNRELKDTDIKINKESYEFLEI